jgi:cytosine/adenosine deaminase-related metal-dependent hydrolase
VGARGAELLDWLDRYVFAEEMRLSDPAYAADVARVFCEQLVRNGTTTALVFGSHDPGAVAACFREGERRRLRPRPRQSPARRRRARADARRPARARATRAAPSSPIGTAAARCAMP